ncbi:MAG: hypothetical protein ACO4CG_09960, partial [Prochlorothrix sp.]
IANASKRRALMRYGYAPHSLQAAFTTSCVYYKLHLLLPVLLSGWLGSTSLRCRIADRTLGLGLELDLGGL